MRLQSFAEATVEWLADQMSFPFWIDKFLAAFYCMRCLLQFQSLPDRNGNGSMIHFEKDKLILR